MHTKMLAQDKVSTPSLLCQSSQGQMTISERVLTEDFLCFEYVLERGKLQNEEDESVGFQ